MAKAKKAKSVAKPKKKGRQPDKAVASDTPRSQGVRCTKHRMYTICSHSIHVRSVEHGLEDVYRPQFERARETRIRQCLLLSKQAELIPNQPLNRCINATKC